MSSSVAGSRRKRYDFSELGYTHILSLPDLPRREGSTSSLRSMSSFHISDSFADAIAAYLIFQYHGEYRVPQNCVNMILAVVRTPVITKKCAVSLAKLFGFYGSELEKGSPYSGKRAALKPSLNPKP